MQDSLALKAGTFVFLGDFVDRGQNSTEVTMYMLCQKILTPHKIYLTRGNHEVEITNSAFTLPYELREKFGPEFGKKLFIKLNEV